LTLRHAEGRRRCPGPAGGGGRPRYHGRCRRPPVPLNAEIDRHVEQHLDRALEELKRLCRQPSVSARNEGTRECAELVAGLLRGHGFEARLIELPGGPPVVYGEAPGGG